MTLPDAVPLVMMEVLDGVSGAVFGLMVPLIAADVTRRSGFLNFGISSLALAGGLGATFSTTAAGWVADTMGAPAAFFGLAHGRLGRAAGDLAAAAGDPRQSRRSPEPRSRCRPDPASCGPRALRARWRQPHGETEMPEAPQLSRTDRRLSVPARVHSRRAREGRQQHLGLSDRRHRERDDDAAQPRGAGRDRTAPARAARRVEGGCEHDVPRHEAAAAGDAGAGRFAGIVPSGRCRDRGPRRHGVRRADHRQFGDEAGAGGGGEGGDRAEDLPALCARRRCLGGRRRASRGGCRLQRVRHHGGYRVLQPARARHHRALRQAVARGGHRACAPGGVLLGQREALQGQAQHSADPEGHRHRRGCGDRLRARRRCGVRVEPWRAPARRMAAARWTCCRR